MPGGDISREIASVLLKHGYSGVRKIGEGSFGVAVLVENKDGLRSVVKLVNVSKASSGETQEARREARLLSRLKHPYIVRYRENFADRGWLCIVMDYCAGGDVTERLETAKANNEQLPEDRVLRWITQAALALKFLHDSHVLHRDLKPSNLFLTQNGDLRVGDFGIAKALEGTADFAKSFVGTPYYISPEVMQEMPYSWPADVWSLGCILFQMCALRVPFEAREFTTLAAKINEGEIPRLPPPYSEPLRQLCGEMMCRSAEARLTVNQVIDSAVIQEGVKQILRAKKEKSAAKAAAEDDDGKPSVRFEILDQFNRFDRNGDGVVDRAELAQVLTHLDGQVWTDDRVDHVLQVADVNKDGRIQLDEFIRWIFGGGSEVGLVERMSQTIDLALKATELQDLKALCETLLSWRQAVDIGCLRVSSPEICVRTCKALAAIGQDGKELFKGNGDDDAVLLSTALDAARHLGAILDAAWRLLAEITRRRVVRVAGVPSPNSAYLRGFCLELADGTRLGTAPAGLTDGGLEACGACWKELQEAEHIVEVHGHALGEGGEGGGPHGGGGRGGGRHSANAGRSPPRSASATPLGAAEDGIAASIVICTNQGREIRFGGVGNGAAAVRGSPFCFRLADGLEVESVQFAGRTCKAIREAPFSLCWPRDGLNTAQQALDAAVTSVALLLLDVGWRAGPSQGRHALLQARQLGATVAVPEEVEQALAAEASSTRLPEDWDIEAMPSPTPEDWLIPGTRAGRVQLAARDLTALQVMLNDTFDCKVAKRRAHGAEVAAPCSLELVSAFRLQHWRSWVAFVAKQEAIRAELRANDVQDGKVADGNRPRLKTEGHHPLRMALDDETQSAWLFHRMDARSASADTVSGDFGIDQIAADEDRSYGRGIYLAESSSAADELAAEVACDGNGDGTGGLRCMLLCRATLGRALHDEAMLPDVSRLLRACVGGKHHSVVGDRETRWPDKFYRTFVVYDADQVYPEFLLWYRRLYR
eukprot:TRINITY_DN17840_c5_g1_i1.p1 TRINITY_DN17840_c5_g1~~TRINITY_DN17840_c5_g1_i1.p1  ORF type:complete len:992 (-),score=226.11 TRINITY_DN17840_c5_g1_i1:53-3028(-)